MTVNSAVIAKIIQGYRIAGIRSPVIFAVRLLVLADLTNSFWLLANIRGYKHA